MKVLLVLVMAFAFFGCDDRSDSEKEAALIIVEALWMNLTEEEETLVCDTYVELGSEAAFDRVDAYGQKIFPYSEFKKFFDTECFVPTINGR